MKLNKTIMTAVLGLSLAGLAQAGTVYITGSTAMRSTVYTTLTNVGTVFQSAPTVTLYAGGGSSATYMAFVGTLVGGSGTTTIQCDWSGSEAGYADLVSNLDENFIPSSQLNGIDNGSASPSSFISEPVDLAMADNAQPYSRSKTPTITASTEVGIITFEWVRNNGLWQGTNVTDSQIRQALGGVCPRAVFDGTAAHTNDFVYVSGRDHFSGTRVNAFGDTDFGILSIPVQIEMSSAGVMQDLNPPNGVYGGDYGYSSGGSLAKTMGANTQTASDLYNDETGYSVIAYLGVSDANTAIGAGATLMSYDGVSFSSAAVEQGTYTFWGNEYINYKNGDTGNTDAQTTYNLLRNATTGISLFCDGVKAISLSSMDCSRPGPTGDPSHY